MQAGLTYITSEDGLLEAELTVVKGPAMVGGELVEDTLTFNGCVGGAALCVRTLCASWYYSTFDSISPISLYPGPTLVMRRGDRVRVLLRNELNDSVANIHFHGFHVTPDGRGDNVRVHVPPGKTFQYDFVIPQNHDEGLFWCVRVYIETDLCVGGIGLMRSAAHHCRLHGHVFDRSDHHVSLGLTSLLVVDGGAADMEGTCVAMLFQRADTFV